MLAVPSRPCDACAGRLVHPNCHTAAVQHHDSYPGFAYQHATSPEYRRAQAGSAEDKQAVDAAFIENVRRSLNTGLGGEHVQRF